MSAAALDMLPCSAWQPESISIRLATMLGNAYVQKNRTVREVVMQPAPQEEPKLCQVQVVVHLQLLHCLAELMLSGTSCTVMLHCRTGCHTGCHKCTVTLPCHKCTEQTVDFEVA